MSARNFEVSTNTQTCRTVLLVTKAVLYFTISSVSHDIHVYFSLVVWWTSHCTGVPPCLDQLVEVPQLYTLHH